MSPMVLGLPEHLAGQLVQRHWKLTAQQGREEVDPALDLLTGHGAPSESDFPVPRACFRLSYSRTESAK